MQQLIESVYDIIKDYRQDENKMSFSRVEDWIYQFASNDQTFLLTELKSILEKRYFAKAAIELELTKLIENISKKLGFSTPADFLKVSEFINHQPEGKSQKDLLGMLYNISKKNFDFDILNRTFIEPQYFIYLDDLLCTGDTLFKGLATSQKGLNNGWLYKQTNNQSNLDYLKIKNAKLIILYLVIHKHNFSNFEWRLRQHLQSDIRRYYSADALYYIDNDFRNANSKLEYLFPIKPNQPKQVLDFYTSLNVTEDGVFRNPACPTIETFFSSKENRVRFENIMLQKGLDLYDLAGVQRNPRMRPLGYGLTSHKNFGFGTLCFTYRNVPFNTPLVFWYPYHNWKPLFERKFITYSNTNLAAASLDAEYHNGADDEDLPF